jgi:hypothetical protein
MVNRMRWLLGFCILAMVPSAALAQSDTASVSGRVTDASGAVIVGAQVQATQVETNTTASGETNGEGLYAFTNLRSGTYRLSVSKAGFKTITKVGLILHVQDSVEQNFTLPLGSVTEAVTVTATAVHAETQNTQMGEVIEGSSIRAVPLVSRSYTDLLALQPGVSNTASQLTGAYSGQFESAGFALPLISGDENSGALSVNGMREAGNGFVLNGATVGEAGFGGTAAIPNLDSIAEFRILTNNFDAEYGNYSGGQVNVITKSGANALHGSLYEFVRNSDFDSRGFFDPTRGAYHQNQFGGTFGGPIKRAKVFFFADYQANRKVVGESATIPGLPSPAELGGNFLDRAGLMTGSIDGPYFAQILNQRMGLPAGTLFTGESYFSSGCTTESQCVFPGAVIPKAAFDPVASNILALNIFPTAATGCTSTGCTFSTTAFPQRLTDSKGSGRMDAHTHWGNIAGYYYFDDYTRNDPYWFAPLPLLPGFNALNTGRTELVNVGDTKTLGPSAVNEIRLEYVRLAPTINKPSGGTTESLSALGFVTGAATLGIDPLNASQGVPELDFLGFSVGVPSRILKLFENTAQVLDNLSKVVGTHTLKFGGSFHYTQLTENLSNIENGNFGFGGGETGIDFADFLIGAPSYNPSIGTPGYEQGQSPPSYGRNHYAGAYGQDSWRVRPNLTLNYGLRWEFSTPWSEHYNRIQTIVPGLQSVVFPGSPTGWVFPGDPGIPSTLAPTRYNNFAPRLGLAYSPDVQGGILGKLLGGSGHTSIRLGYGLFYSTFEGSTTFNEIGDPPFGNFVGSCTSPLLDTAFQDRATGGPECGVGQKFPVPPIPTNVSAKNPDNSINWSIFIPLASDPAFASTARLPYAEDYELSLQRQFGSATLLTVSYVGTQGHRLLATLESNPGSPALCLALNALGATTVPVQGVSYPCGPGDENTVFVLPAGAVPPQGSYPFTGTLGNDTCPSGSTCVPGTRPIFNPAFFGSNGYFATIGNSSYNSLQVNLRHSSRRAQFLVGYTFSKSLDNASGYGEEINPINSRLSRALSAFDITNNFVASYSYSLPLDKLGGPNKLTNGWSLSGITRFSTGVPVTLIEADDNSLLGTSFSGPQPLPVDTPDFAGGSVGITDPRTSPNHAYFNTSLFTSSAIGQEGNSPRRFFHGPGVNNWDVALLKDTQLTDRLGLQFRAEFFNVGNHAQFLTPSGNLSSNFGVVTLAAAPRIGQLALKLTF